MDGNDTPSPYQPPAPSPAPSTSTTPTAAVRRKRNDAANEVTTILTPVTDPTDATRRIPIAERDRWRLFAIIGGALAALSIAAAAWLGFVAAGQNTQIDDLTVERAELVEQLQAEQEQVLEQQQAVDALTADLEAERARVIELADLNTETGQQFDTAQEIIEALDEVNAVAASTATVMQTCVDYQSQLIFYLRNSEDYSASQIETYRSQTNAQCDSAQRANELLQDLVAST